MVNTITIFYDKNFKKSFKKLDKSFKLKVKKHIL